MKKTLKILFLAAFTFCIISLNAFAAKYNKINYGGLIADPVTYDSDSSIAHNITVHNKGGYIYEKTQMDSYTGEYSGYIDYTSAVGSFQIVNSGNGMKYHAVMKDNPVYAEIYIKGADFSKGTVIPDLFFANADGSNIGGKASWNFDEPDENGWVRCWTHWYVDKAYTNVNLGLRIERSDPDDYSMSDIFIDDMRLILIPQALEFNDAIAENSRFDLDHMRAFGRNIRGIKTEIFAKDLIKYEVALGDAYINDYGVLVAAKAGRVQLKADFFGKTDYFYIDFPEGEGAVYASEPELADGKYTSIVANESDNSLNIRLQTILTDNGKFVKMIKTDKKITAGETAEFVQEIGKAPFYIANPVYKCCVLIERNGTWVPLEK